MSNVQPDLISQYFRYEHLPEPLQSVSKPFCELAKHIADMLPSNPERTVALRKLLEAKDAGVRAALFQWPPKPGADPHETSVTPR